MSTEVSIPQDYNINFYPRQTMDVDLETVGNGMVASLSSWPSNDLNLGDLNIYMKELPTITLGPLSASVTSWPENTLKLGDLNLHLREVAPVSLGITQLPDINLRLKELPDTRAHIPAHFEVGFSILGFKLFCISLCGEAQLITEPYVPHRLELCP